MKKTAVKIVLYSVLYFIVVFLINAIFIRPGIIRIYGYEPSLMIFSQAFAGVFVPLSLILPAFLIMFWSSETHKITRIIIFPAIYIFLTFSAFMLFLTPSFGIISIMLAVFIIASITFLTISLDYFIATFKLPRYWRSLIVIIIIFAMLTTVLWMNPIFEANTKNTDNLTELVDVAVTANPAVVIIDNVFKINMFRSGNFYSHSGGAGLSLIGDYFVAVSYLSPAILYPLLYFILGAIFLTPALLIRRFRK